MSFNRQVAAAGNVPAATSSVEVRRTSGYSSSVPRSANTPNPGVVSRSSVHEAEVDAR